MKYLLCDESGASSVLIVFMMLVLVILGAYSISSAHVNYTFSRRALSWKQAYYDCSAKAEEFLADVDSALARAEKETAEAVFHDNTGAAREYDAQSINELYKRNILKGYAQLADKYNMEINEDTLALNAVISSGGEFQIAVRVAPSAFRYAIDSSNGTIRGVLNENRKRYTILEWRQVQEVSENGAVQGPLWDGIVR